MRSGRRLAPALALLFVACELTRPVTPILPSAPDASQLAGIHKIRHVVIIMQENRSFDSYFGTFPGADGIPMRNGVPTVCLPNPDTNRCVRPFHDAGPTNAGGPHTSAAAVADIDGGRMDGFVAQAAESLKGAPAQCQVDPTLPICSATPTAVMGYRDAREIPNGAIGTMNTSP